MSTIIEDMKRIFLLVIFILITTALYSQEMKLYAPFPSRIKAETSGTNIILSWKDAKDILEGDYEIYRSDTAITADNLNLAQKIGDAVSGIETYIDTPPVGTNLFYAVFAKDDTQSYKICIPYRNVTTTAILIEESDIEETKSTIISQMQAQSRDIEVSIQLGSSLGDRSVILFRNTQVIDTYEKLIKSINLSEEKGYNINYTDTPIAGINYYYAAVDAELFRSGSENLLYDGNYTKDQVQVKFSHEIESDSMYIKSTMPLPLLQVSADLESGELFNEPIEVKQEGTISSENIRSIKNLVNRSNYSYGMPDLSVLGYNKNINPIISDYFLNRNWAETINQLESFTSLNYNSETRIQSHFYRGQAYFFMGLYNNAMIELIMIEKELFVETEPFFHAIFRIKKTS